MAAGDFSASLLGDILVKQQEMWQNPRTLNAFNEPTETAKALMENQLVSWKPIMEDGNKCIGHKAIWLKDTSDTVTDCSSGNALANCDISGAQIESDGKLFPENLCLRDSFSILDDQCKDAFDLADKTAFRMLRSKTKLQKALNAKFIAFLEANLMANAFAGTYGTIHGGTTATYFASQYWTQDIVAELDLTAVINKVRTPIIINGTNLRSAFFNSGFNRLNDNQKDQFAKFSHFNMFWDVMNIDGAVSAKATYLVDAGMVGFFNSNAYNNTAPVLMNDDKNTHVWHETSPNLAYRDGSDSKPLRFDVTMLRKCTTVGNRRKWGYHYEVQLTGGLHLGPTNTSTDKGILKFVNGTAPV